MWVYVGYSESFFMFMGNHVFAVKLTFDLVSVSISSLYPIRKNTFLKCDPN